MLRAFHLPPGVTHAPLCQMDINECTQQLYILAMNKYEINLGVSNQITPDP